MVALEPWSLPNACDQKKNQNREKNNQFLRKTEITRRNENVPEKGQRTHVNMQHAEMGLVFNLISIETEGEDPAQLLRDFLANPIQYLQ